jgi:tetratricopeptide (TPR) repeat protein
LSPLAGSCHYRVVSSPLIEEGLAALRDGDTATARRAFGLALAEGEPGEALEGLAEALYLEREYAAAAAQYERACSAYRRERQTMAAGRAARTAAWITGNVLGDWAVRSGWLARARTILEEAGEDRPEHGWVLIIKAFSQPDAQVREELLREAIAVGRRFGDPDIEFAETQLVEAARHFDRGMSARRAAAIIRLADLRVRQGRLEEAAQLLDGLEQHPDVVPTLAALHLARGEMALARDLLERATEGPDDEVPTVGESTMVGPLLALLVDVHLEQGNLNDAERVTRRLTRVAEAQRGLYLRAVAALAKGRICVASGKGDARACLHEALEGFARAQLPMELARTRLEMARARWRNARLRSPSPKRERRWRTSSG